MNYFLVAGLGLLRPDFFMVFFPQWSHHISYLAVYSFSCFLNLYLLKYLYTSYDHISKINKYFFTIILNIKEKGPDDSDSPMVL